MVTYGGVGHPPLAIKCRKLFHTLYRLYFARIQGIYTENIHEDTVKRLVLRFFKFIALKTIYGNDTGTDFSPGFETDEVWHKVILDTSLYRDIQRTCGRTLDHYPENAMDSKDVISRRYILGSYMMEKVFGPKWLIGDFNSYSVKARKADPYGFNMSLGVDRNGLTLGC